MDPSLSALNSQELFGMGLDNPRFLQRGCSAISGFLSISRPLLPIARDVFGEHTTLAESLVNSLRFQFLSQGLISFFFPFLFRGQKGVFDFL